MIPRRSTERGRPPAELTRWTRARVLVMGGLLMAALGATLVRAVSLQVLQRARLTSMATDQTVPGDGDPRPARRHLRPPWHPAGPERGGGLALAGPLDGRRPPARCPRPRPDAPPGRRRARGPARPRPPLRLGEAPGDTSGGHRSRSGWRFPAWGSRRSRSASTRSASSGPRCWAWSAPTATGSRGSSWRSRTSCPDRARRWREPATPGAGISSSRARPRPSAGRGATVTLTLDRQVQYVAEKALDRAVDESKAIAGMLVVLDPRTGELLALAQTPRVNPNAPAPGIAAGALRDRPALDLFEPGSTYKAFVAAAALEDRAIRPEDVLRLRGRELGGGPARHPRHPPPRDAEPSAASSRSPRTSARPRWPSGSGARA